MDLKGVNISTCHQQIMNIKKTVDNLEHDKRKKELEGFVYRILIT